MKKPDRATPASPLEPLDHTTGIAEAPSLRAFPHLSAVVSSGYSGRGGRSGEVDRVPTSPVVTVFIVLVVFASSQQKKHRLSSKAVGINQD